MNDIDKKTKLPIHLIFVASNYAKKVQEILKIRQIRQPVTELTRFGCV